MPSPNSFSGKPADTYGFCRVPWSCSYRFHDHGLRTITVDALSEILMIGSGKDSQIREDLPNSMKLLANSLNRMSSFNSPVNISPMHAKIQTSFLTISNTTR